jgi:hypothetical protein
VVPGSIRDDTSEVFADSGVGYLEESDGDEDRGRREGCSFFLYLVWPDDR